MNIIEKKVEVFKAYAYCDCGEKLRDTGRMLTSYPPQYVHICKKCGKEENLESCYPTILYREKGEK